MSQYLILLQIHPDRQHHRLVLSVNDETFEVDISLRKVEEAAEQLLASTKQTYSIHRDSARTFLQKFGRLLSGEPVRQPLPNLDGCADALHESITIHKSVQGAIQTLSREAPPDSPGCLLVECHDDPISDLPWELLRHETRRVYFACDWRLPMARQPAHCEASRAPAAFPLTRQSQVAIASASPNGLCKLDINKEVDVIYKALNGLEGESGPDQIKNASLNDISNRRFQLRAPWRVFHFIGHGQLNATGEPELVLHDNSQPDQPRHCKASLLAQVLTDGTPPGLVILNCCHSRAAAETMVRNGIPAALGMQGAIPDPEAPAFVKMLYTRLQRNEPLEVAVAAARRELAASCWWMPVLYRHPSCIRVAQVSINRQDVVPRLRRLSQLGRRELQLLLQDCRDLAQSSPADTVEFEAHALAVQGWFAFEQLNNLTDAEQLLRTALSSYPEWPEYWHCLGRVLASVAGRLEPISDNALADRDSEAMRCHNEAVRAATSDPHSRYFLHRARLRLVIARSRDHHDLVSGAISDFRSAIRYGSKGALQVRLELLKLLDRVDPTEASNEESDARMFFAHDADAIERIDKRKRGRP